MTNGTYLYLHPKIELTVLLFAIDYIEAVGDCRLHIGHFEVKPLMMVIRIDVGV